PAGGHKSCTITNDDIAPTLTLTKVVNKTHGGTANPDDFKLTVGSSPVLSGVKNIYKANLALALNETQLKGYHLVSVGVSVGDDTKCPTVLGGSVTLAPGDNVSCTIVNEDLAPQLTLIK